MASAKVVEKSVANNSLSQDSSHPDDQIIKVIYHYTKVGGIKAPTSPSFRHPCITEHKSLYMIQILHVVELRIHLH